MKTIKQIIVFKKATPHQLYEAIIDPKIHSKFSSSKATNEQKVGGKFTAYDDYCWGTNLELIKDKKIVQEWTSSDLPENTMTKVTYEFKKEKEGTQIIFTQENVPDKNVKSLEKGWEDFYWTPLKEMFD